MLVALMGRGQWPAFAQILFISPPPHRDPQPNVPGRPAHPLGPAVGWAAPGVPQCFLGGGPSSSEELSKVRSITSTSGGGGGAASGLPA
mgnify:CR=1 FL=1